MNPPWADLDDETLVDALMVRLPLGVDDTTRYAVIFEVWQAVGEERAYRIADRIRGRAFAMLDEKILRDPSLLSVFDEEGA